MNNITCFTHNDLDGVVSSLVVRWFHPSNKVVVVPVSSNSFRSVYTHWMLHNTPTDHKIFITDLDIHEDIDLIDSSNVTVIDHHATHDTHKYNKAEVVVREASSASMMVYKHLSEKNPDIELNRAQKTLIILADDYDSYTLAIPDSSKLNTVYFNTQNRFEVFSNQWANGFDGFTTQQDNHYRLLVKERDQVLNSLEGYQCEQLKIGSKTLNVVATYAKSFINEVADYMLEHLKADIVFVVNLQTQRVSVRRSKECIFPVNKLAAAVLDGGGHEAAAGGKITEEFIELTKKLKPVFTGN